MALAVLGRVAEGFLLATDRILGSTEEPSARFSPDSTASMIFLSSSRPLGLLIWGAGSLGRNVSSEIAAWIEGPRSQEGQRTQQVAYGLARSLTQKARHRFAGLLPHLRPRIGFFLAGFEGDEKIPRDWVWEMKGEGRLPHPVRTGQPAEPQYGFNWRGEELWMTRLILGYDPTLLDLLEGAMALNREQLIFLFRKVELPLSYSAMPMEQAIELASWMIRTTLGLLHLQSYPRKWEWEIEAAIITPQGARWVLPQEGEKGGN
jgi:hypothetical protein